MWNAFVTFLFLFVVKVLVLGPPTRQAIKSQTSCTSNLYFVLVKSMPCATSTKTGLGPWPWPALVGGILRSAHYCIYLERDFACQCRTDRSSFGYLREGVCKQALPDRCSTYYAMVEPDPLLLRSRVIWGRRNYQVRRISRYCPVSATQAAEVYFTKYPSNKLNMFRRVFLHEEGPLLC
jgi:hypothetical protein